jgi:hypothetical protein
MILKFSASQLQRGHDGLDSKMHSFQKLEADSGSREVFL